MFGKRRKEPPPPKAVDKPKPLPPMRDEDSPVAIPVFPPARGDGS